MMNWAALCGPIEIGIRMALGATRGSILQMIPRQGMRMARIGIGAGLVSAAILTKVMSTMLYGVDPGDPAAFFSVAAVVAFTARLACMGLALRAAMASCILRNSPEVTPV